MNAGDHRTWIAHDVEQVQRAVRFERGTYVSDVRRFLAERDPRWARAVEYAPLVLAGFGMLEAGGQEFEQQCRP